MRLRGKKLKVTINVIIKEKGTTTLAAQEFLVKSDTTGNVESFNSLADRVV